MRAGAGIGVPPPAAAAAPPPQAVRPSAIRPDNSTRRCACPQYFISAPPNMSTANACALPPSLCRGYTPTKSGTSGIVSGRKMMAAKRTRRLQTGCSARSPGRITGLSEVLPKHRFNFGAAGIRKSSRADRTALSGYWSVQTSPIHQVMQKRRGPIGAREFYGGLFYLPPLLRTETGPRSMICFPEFKRSAICVVPAG